MSRLFNCPVVFCSSKRSVNINKLFKAIICQFYKVDCGFEEMRTPGQPVFIYNEFLKPEKDQEHGPFRKESGFEQTPAIGASG